MPWSSSMLGQLRSVRDLRLRVAELALSRAEAELVARRDAESRAHQGLSDTVERSAAETEAANLQLLQRSAGGRMGITAWQTQRKKAQRDVAVARQGVDDAVAGRIGQEQQRDDTRAQWRSARFGVERLRLMADEQERERR